jgi:hypothetical protein
MIELSGKITFLGRDDLLKQFTDCDVCNINMMKIKYDIVRNLKDSDIVIFIDDKNNESKGTRILMKSKY